jgi:hypothetical protein
LLPWIRWSCCADTASAATTGLPRSNERGYATAWCASGNQRVCPSLSIAWQDGEIRPTHRKQRRGPRTWPTRADDFIEVWPRLSGGSWDSPDTSTKELFLRLQELTPDQFQRGQLRTLQRRVKAWRSEMVRHLVFGVGSESATSTSASTIAS